MDPDFRQDDIYNKKKPKPFSFVLFLVLYSQMTLNQSDLLVVIFFQPTWSISL